MVGGTFFYRLPPDRNSQIVQRVYTLSPEEATCSSLGKIVAQEATYQPPPLRHAVKFRYLKRMPIYVLGDQQDCNVDACLHSAALQWWCSGVVQWLSSDIHPSLCHDYTEFCNENKLHVAKVIGLHIQFILSCENTCLVRRKDLCLVLCTIVCNFPIST